MQQPKNKKPQHVTKVATNYGDVLLDAANGQYWHLNETAAIVYAKLSEGGAAEDAVNSLVDQYGISEELARKDVATVIAQMAERDLL